MKRFILIAAFLITAPAFAVEVGVVDGPGGWQRDGNNIRVSNPGQDIVTIDNLEIGAESNWQTVIGQVFGTWGVHLHTVGVTSCQVLDRNGSTFKIDNCTSHRRGEEYEVFSSEFPNLTSLAPPYSSTFVSISSTTVLLSDTFTTSEQLKTRIPLGRVQETLAGGYSIIDLRPIISEKDRLDYTFRRELFGPAVGIDGGLVAFEVVGAPRTLSITGGKFGDERGQVHDLPSFNSLTGLTIWTTTPDPFPNITAVRGLLTIDNLNYNNRTTGGLVAAQNNNKWIYMDFVASPSGGSIDGIDSGRGPTWFLFYGTGEFDSEVEARNAPINLSNFGASKPKLLNLWRLLLRKNQTNIESFFDLRPFFGQLAGAPAAIQATINLQGAYNLSPNSGIPEIKTNDINEDVTILYEGTNGKILELQKGDGTPVFVVYTSKIEINGSPVTGDLKTLHLEERYPSGTNGGTSVGASFNIRKPSTEVIDEGGFSRYSSTTNEIIMQPGDYRDCIIWATGAYTNRHQVRLRDISRGLTRINGLSAYSAGSLDAATTSVGYGNFTTTVERNYQLQQYFNASKATTGLGVAAISGEPEVYAGIRCSVGGI